jgi:hypothetical protein
MTSHERVTLESTALKFGSREAVQALATEVALLQRDLEEIRATVIEADLPLSPPVLRLLLALGVDAETDGGA